MFNRTKLLAPLGLLVGGCAFLGEGVPDDGAALPYVISFAQSRVETKRAGGWENWTFSRFKKPTRYELVEDAGKLVMKASAGSSASGLMHRLRLDPASYPLLTWRWKVNKLIESADNTRRQTEDSPVRVFVTFDGEIERLPLAEQLLFDDVYLMTGRRMPYATLVYIWENRAPRDTVIPNAHTSRIIMIVAESGRDNLGRWQEVTRNIVEDFKRAFDETPDAVTAVGIMTDTDNTGTEAEGFYGDIRFLRAP